MNERWLPLRGRPQALLSRLDEAYLAFARGLPARLRTAALNRNTYTGLPGDGRLDRVSGLNPVLAASPWLFWDSFGCIDDDTFLQVAEAGCMLVLGSLLLDHLIDGQVTEPETVLLLSQALYSRSVSGFRSVEVLGERFWQRFEGLEARLVAGLALEVALRQKPRPYRGADVREIARGKAAPVVATLAALAMTLGLQSTLTAIEASLGQAVAASLFADDMMDWRQDLAAGRLTPFLMGLGPPAFWSQPTWPSAAEVEGLINADWADAEHLHEAISSLDAALEAVEEVSCSHWKWYLSDHRDLAQRHHAACITRHVARTVKLLHRADEAR